MKKISYFLIIFYLWNNTLLARDVTLEEKLRTLQQDAEKAIRSSEYHKAKIFLGSLLKEVSPPISNNLSNKYVVDWNTYMDIALRLGRIYLDALEFEQGEEYLISIIDQNPPPEYLGQIKILLARFQCAQNAPIAAFLLFQESKELFPFKQWNGIDRSFYLGLSSMLDAHFTSILKRAEVLFAAKLYDEAIPLYENALKGIEEGTYPSATIPLEKQIRYRLAEGFFAKTNYEKTLSLIDELRQGDVATELEHEALYLSALTYLQRHEYEKAVSQFQAYLHDKNESDLSHFKEALFEIAHLHYQEKHFDQAQEYFERCDACCNSQSSHLSLVSRLYLSRIYLEKKNYDKGEEILNHLLENLPKKHPLICEVLYLKGSYAYQQSHYLQAIAFFEQLFPSKTLSTDGYKAPWTYQAFFYLGESYLKLAETSQYDKTLTQDFFNKSENIFKNLIENEGAEKGFIGLGKLYLSKYKYLSDEESRVSLMLTLLPRWKSFSLDGQIKALWLLGEGGDSYEEKDLYYSLATQKAYEESSLYPECWCRVGLNYFYHALQENPSNPTLVFEKAVRAFEKAFLLFEHQDQQKAAFALKMKAEANYYCDTPDSLASSIAILDKLLYLYHSLDLSPADHTQTLYIKGLVAARLSTIDDNQTYAQLAIESLKEVISRSNGQQISADALNVLATLYHRQKKEEEAFNTFLELGTSYPNSVHAPKSWYWVGLLGTSLNRSPQETAQAFYQVYTYYPDSSYAPEAYFQVFTLEDYQTYQEKSILHLAAFPELFPHSPLCVAAYYYLGKDFKEKKNYAQAKEAFSKSIAAYKTSSEQKIHMEDFRLRSLLETAIILFEEGKNQGNDLLCFLLEEIHEKVTKTKLYLQIYQECEVTLAKMLLNHQQVRLAEVVLTQLLTHFRSTGIQKGIFLAQAWSLSAQIALKKKEFQIAIEYLKMAESFGEGHLPQEEVLDLWMHQAKCYEHLGKYMDAMRTLSRIINEDVVSPLRLQAMYQRAVLYQLQGRDELAVRQLEAVAKKGGLWADKAKETLKSEYEMHTSRSWIHYE